MKIITFEGDPNLSEMREILRIIINESKISIDENKIPKEIKKYLK